MLHSMALWLRLALMRLKRPGHAAGAVAELPRPDGPLLWVQIGAETLGETAPGAVLLLARLRQLRPELRVILVAPPWPQWPEAVQRVDLPRDCPATARHLLAHLRPRMILLLGNELPPALISEAVRAGVKLILADAQMAPLGPRRGLFARAVQHALLRRLAHVSVRDQDSLAPLIRLGADPRRIEVGGVMGTPPEPLRCSEAERASIAALTRTRPVWLAAAVPAAEIEAVLAAHEQAQHHAHRMLLLLAPDTEECGAELAARIEAGGWTVSRRSQEGEPDADTEIFVADEAGEYGLWYRIAPVCYMGGTLSGAAGHGRSPFEAAALGSAILHGPQTAPFGADYARLDEARAARTIYDERSLGEAVADLMAPDRAAILAHNAWAVTSGGAAAAESVVRAVLRQFDAPTEKEKG